MRPYKLIPAIAFCLSAICASGGMSDQGPGPTPKPLASGMQLASPDGKLQLSFALTGEGEPVYTVSYLGSPVLHESRLGFASDREPSLASGFRVAGSKRTSHDERWKPVAGERAEVRDHYQALSVKLEPGGMEIEFRAYDEGVAFRYRFAQALTLTNELSEFRFGGDPLCWPVYSAQGVYSQQRLSALRPGCERPLTVKMPGARWAAVGEAALVDFPRMRLQPSGNPSGIRAQLGGSGTVPAGATSPWRFVLLAESAAQLLERNDLILNLNEPCAITDTSWIKPGTVIREATLTTDGGKACVDFAARMGIQYVEFDAGWYGPEDSNLSDARAVNLDPRRSKGPLDLQAVIRYAEEHRVGVILYVNRRALEKQLDDILPLYASWGVKGVKYGFVNVGSQQWTAWLHQAVANAARHRLIVDIHDEYRPTGVSRTWPNLLTQEGVRGNEEMPPAAHNLVLPFTRYLCGAADYTFCWNDARLKNTRTHQLAASVVFFSPLQFLFWYDRPPQIADEPALEFWRHLPTTWDDTRVLEGVPGEFISVARRKGSTWYIGSMNGIEPRKISLRTDFLKPGKTYEALICRDEPAQGGGRALVDVERKEIRGGAVLEATALANGGLAVRLSPPNR